MSAAALVIDDSASLRGVLQNAPVGELTIAQAQMQREALLVSLAEDNPEWLLDLGQIEACDSAGVQLLLAAKASAAGRNRQLRITAASESVRQACETYGLTELLLGRTGAAT